jgi:hypothetical protein
MFWISIWVSIADLLYENMAYYAFVGGFAEM